ncbi:hypothetical protein ACQP2X_44215 [Actinoplanes sp. CA-131856]
MSQPSDRYKVDFGQYRDAILDVKAANPELWPRLRTVLNGIANPDAQMSVLAPEDDYATRIPGSDPPLAIFWEYNHLNRTAAIDYFGAIGANDRRTW